MAQVGDDVFYVTDTDFSTARIVGIPNPGTPGVANLIVFHDSEDDGEQAKRYTGVYQAGDPGAPNVTPNWTYEYPENGR